MSTHIEKAATINYAEKLRERIKSALVDIIPDEEWDKMLRAEVSAFFEDKTIHNDPYYRPTVTVHPSGFKVAVREVLQAAAKERITQMLASAEWTGFWDGQKKVAGVQLTDWIKANAAEILSAWLAQPLSMVLLQIQQQLRQVGQ